MTGRSHEAQDHRVDPRLSDRMRWRCRRGMLELDLVLNAFRERHLAQLDDARIEAFTAILARTDPELLDLIMGRSEGLDAHERELLHLMRSESCNDTHPSPRAVAKES